MANRVFATNRLRLYRIENGYTQQEMQTLFGIEANLKISFSTYQKWEQGSLGLPSNVALLLARFTKIPINELVERK